MRVATDSLRTPLLEDLCPMLIRTTEKRDSAHGLNFKKQYIPPQINIEKEGKACPVPDHPG